MGTSEGAACGRARPIRHYDGPRFPPADGHRRRARPLCGPCDFAAAGLPVMLVGRPCGRPDRSTRSQAAGAVVPLHHAAGIVGRAHPGELGRAGGAQAQDTGARWNDAPGAEPAGAAAAAGGRGAAAAAAAAAASDPVPRGAGEADRCGVDRRWFALHGRPNPLSARTLPAHRPRIAAKPRTRSKSPAPSPPPVARARARACGAASAAWAPRC